MQALLIVLMAGTEVFRPLRDLRMVLHQGMLGQSAAAGINALFAAEPLVSSQTSNRAGNEPAAASDHRLRGCLFRLSRRAGCGP